MAATWGWINRLVAEDFSAGCKEDRFCVPCAAAFCNHCCGAHHRGQGHEVVVRAAAEGTQQAAQPGAAQPGAAQGNSASSRDSFCVSCGASFSSALCAHHTGPGHDTFRIDIYDGRYCARCTGSEPWFRAAFAGIDTYIDKEGHILVPLHPRTRWINRLLAEDFSAGCKEDRFCVPCAAAFCHHCCGAHHRGQGHEVIVNAAAEGTQQAAQPGAAQGNSASSRDSFCVSCGVGFSAALCTHHTGPSHDTFRIVIYDGRYCARCTGSEPWFHATFDNIHTYRDKEGHILVPLHPHPRCARARRS